MEKCRIIKWIRVEFDSTHHHQTKRGSQSAPSLSLKSLQNRQLISACANRPLLAATILDAEDARSARAGTARSIPPITTKQETPLHGTFFVCRQCVIEPPKVVQPSATKSATGRPQGGPFHHLPIPCFRSMLSTSPNGPCYPAFDSIGFSAYHHAPDAILGGKRQCARSHDSFLR